MKKCHDDFKEDFGISLWSIYFFGPSNIRGKAYDGASVMSRGKEGVQAKIKEISPLALFTHCYAHCLNLSIATSCKLSEVRNLIGQINEAYLFLNNSPSDNSCLRWLGKNTCLRILTASFQVYGRHAGWRHTCLDFFQEMYELLVTFLDAFISPYEYPNLKSSTWSWNCDKDTITKAQGLKASLLSFQTVVVFIATRNTLDEVKTLASKLQKRDQDIFEAYMMVDEVIGNIKSVRKNIDSDFQVWYKQILDLAEKLGIVEAIFPGRHAYRGIAQTFPAVVQFIITKNLWLFPFLILWLFKCKTNFLTKIATPVTCFI